MDQPDQVRQPKESAANWLAHRGPMGKRPPTGASIPNTTPLHSLQYLYFKSLKKLSHKTSWDSF
ncbi:hypothetical protein CSV77_10815 [Sporosarcina sp. P16b]|nr:hypothetical protein CSV77_10815 [Sporosarcina sp. P16b]